MKHYSFRPWGFVAALCGMLLLLGHPSWARRVTDTPRGPVRHLDAADPESKKSLIAHDVGNVRTTLANWGEIGNPDNTPGFKGFEFPINSGNDFLFSAGVWVGAEVNGVRHVSTTTDGDNGTNEFYPVHIGTIPASRQNQNFGDWFVSSKSFDFFNNLPYVWGAKGKDDDGDWTTADDLDHNGKASENYDLGHGLIGIDDDGDGRIDEDSVAYNVAAGVWTDIDGDGDGNFDDTGPSGDANHDLNCNYDPEHHVDEDPAGDISHDYIDNDNDGLVDMADPDYDGDLNPGFLDDDNDGRADEDGIARGAQEYFCVYQDDIEPSYVGSPDPTGHTPMKIMMLQRTYAFPEAYAGDFILVDYRIRNFGPLPLEHVYIAMFADPDIVAVGESGDIGSADDLNYYDSTRTMALQYDNPNDADGWGPGIFAIRVCKTPLPSLSDLKVSFANFGRLAGGDPPDDVSKYNMISSGVIMPPTQQLDDQRMLIGFGAAVGNGFTLDPGKELPITVALIAGHDTVEGGKNAEWALRMYLNDFQGPQAPDVPVFALDMSPFQPDSGTPPMVRIRWLNNAEASVDPITKLVDFEGYIVERSTDQLAWQTIAAFDRMDTLVGEFEWQNFNTGMPPTRTFPGDTLLWYYYEDHDLIPGHTYYYCVRAYDQGVSGAGMLYSGRTGNVQSAVLARTATTRAPVDLKQVYVFPNPYRGSHPGEAGGQVNASKGLLEYPRKLMFMGLPANTASHQCLIHIYSLAGDHLATIDHINGTEQEMWDMITKNRQEIVSGIYYYIVEYGGDSIIDKFVVIK
jgi:hypothetical protein